MIGQILKFASGREVLKHDLSEISNLEFHCKSPVIVLGTPRSGTSTVARCLSEYFGIKMGLRFFSKDARNPGGSYEDRDFADANEDFASGKINLREWEKRAFEFFYKMESLGVPWGFKDPRILRLIGAILPYFEEHTIVRTWRPRRLVVQSRVKYLGWEEPSSDLTYTRDMVTLDRLLKHYPHIQINFTRQLSDMDIIKTLSTESKKLWD